jgi:Domain of unknown function (DUF4783)
MLFSIANISRKLKTITLIMMCLLISFASYAGIIEDLSACFRSGKISSIEEHLSNNCEIDITGNKSTVNKMQAKLLLEGFFSKNSPSDFTITTSNTLAGSKYAVGKLSTSMGKFDVYITLDAMDSNIITGIKIN